MAHGMDAGEARLIDAHESFGAAFLRNILVALTVSFIALSLGAAFGVLSGRGAFAGMFSAGLIAFIAAALGGTRVQCSGPTAPMAAVMATLSMLAVQHYNDNPLALGGMTPDHYLNLICLLCGAFMIVMAVLRTGVLIHYVPDFVISGFMTGIALIIWTSQSDALFGITKPAMSGTMPLNIGIAVVSLAIVFATKPVLQRMMPRLAPLIPGALVALVVMVLTTFVLKLDVQYVALDTHISGWRDLVALIKAQIPQNISWDAIQMGAYPGFELALISFLDTLMVALIIDRMTGETTRKNKEVMAQGVANVAVGFIGGVPGTQASIRSVLMIKEGATWRAAGIMVGLFVMIEMLMFQDLIKMIPKAAFAGILMKVGWDVCDKKPIWAYLTRKSNRPTTLDFITLVGTAVVTVYDLTLAVLTFTVLWYSVRFIAKRRAGLAPVTHVDNAIGNTINSVLDDASGK